ncbi:aspartate ammonia-lyase [Tessaracoccus sp.]
MTNTRVETDMLGTRDVPAEAYFGIHTVRAVENFHISQDTVNDLPDLIRGLVQVKKAAALANRDLQVLGPDVVNSIVWACDQILDEQRCLDQFPIDLFQGGAGTSTNMNVNEVLANLALEHLGCAKGSYGVIDPIDHVNRSQSTNDAYPSGLRLALDTRLGHLAEAVDRLSESLLHKGVEFADVITMGRTQLQDAVPMTLGQEFTATSVTIGEELRHIEAVRGFLLEVNLGATAIGTGVNTPPGYAETVIRHLREITGRPCGTAADLIEATSDTGVYVTAHGVCKRLAVKLSKACNDLRLLSSGPRAGLNEINLPSMQAGSSIMPSKVNPVIPEVVNQVCFKVMGNDMCVTVAAEAGQLQLNAMEPVIAQALFESIALLLNACDTLRTKCIDGITANREVCLGYVTNSISVVTFLNNLIGHAAGDEVGREAAITGKSVRNIVLERGLLDVEILDQVLSLENLLHVNGLGKSAVPRS